VEAFSKDETARMALKEAQNMETVFKFLAA
jgi:hypothetical protein